MKHACVSDHSMREHVKSKRGVQMLSNLCALCPIRHRIPWNDVERSTPHSHRKAKYNALIRPTQRQSLRSRGRWHEPKRRRSTRGIAPTRAVQLYAHRHAATRVHACQLPHPPTDRLVHSYKANTVRFRRLLKGLESQYVTLLRSRNFWCSYKNQYYGH